MLEFAGKNATEMFEDIGHSNEARKKMAEYLVGSLQVQNLKRWTTNEFIVTQLKYWRVAIKRRKQAEQKEV